MSPLAKEALTLMFMVVVCVGMIGFTLWVTFAMPCNRFPGFVSPPSRCVVMRP